MKKILAVLGVLAIVALVIGTLGYLWAKSRTPDVVFETETPFVSDIVKKTVATGSVIPRKEVAIKPQVSGILSAILVEAGQVVKDGDPIARIRVIPDTASLAAAESRVKRARIALQDAERDLERQARLQHDGTIAASALDKATVSRDQGLEELSAATEGLEIILRGSSARSGASSNTLVRSTLDGMVLDVPVEEGASVIESNTFNEGTTIASIADMGSLVFEGTVDESEVGKLQPGMRLVLAIGALQDSQLDATLEHVAPKGKAESGAIKFEIRAAVEPKEGVFIRANYSASADIVLDRRDKVLAIHESVLQFEGEKPFVEVETSPQAFERREIALGLSDGITAEVLSGVTATDRIKKPVALRPGS